MEKTPDHTGRVPTRKRRARYILVACLECRRRKIKCSGGQPCESCAFHEITCSYPQEGDGEPSKKESSSTTKKRREPGHMRVERPARPRAPSRADAELQERLRRLEEEVFQRTSYPPSHISLDQSPTAVIDEGIRMRQNEKNQFCACGRAIAESDLQDYEDVDTPDDESQGRTTAYISLAMQIRTLKEAVPEPVWSDGHSALPQTDVETCLISNDRLYYLLDLFFSEFNCYIVAIDCSDFMTRLESLFQESSVSQSQQLSIQNAKPEQITLIALACMILAKAELLSVEPRTESQFYRSHQSWYAESCRVMARYYQTRPSNFDLVQLRLVESFYMIALERVDRFSSAVMNAVNEAFAAGLNDQSLWKNCSKTEITSRCALWWTMYLMDRQAAQRYGRSYLIRDTDFSVQDFTAECKQPLSVDGEVPIPFLHYPGLKIRLENQEYSSPQTTSSGYLSEYEWYHYLQFIATIGRLVTRACDSFYCYCAPKKGDYEETESIDALLLRARRNLCPSLLWYTGNSMPDVNMPTVSAQIMRLRIISFLVRIFNYYNIPSVSH
ncbi:hypothetical protein F5884DRAFT_429908 [Xylogone sp. PMI_703]|nr:hypothetical protein F5884DRAFT_429908 [Xylogone sp. PMI_703]